MNNTKKNIDKRNRYRLTTLVTLPKHLALDKYRYQIGKFDFDMAKRFGFLEEKGINELFYQTDEYRESEDFQRIYRFGYILIESSKCDNPYWNWNYLRKIDVIPFSTLFQTIDVSSLNDQKIINYLGQMDYFCKKLKLKYFCNSICLLSFSFFEKIANIDNVFIEGEYEPINTIHRPFSRIQESIPEYISLIFSLPSNHNRHEPYYFNHSEQKSIEQKLGIYVEKGFYMKKNPIDDITPDGAAKTSFAAPNGNPVYIDRRKGNIEKTLIKI